MEDMKNEADTTTSAVSMALYTVMYPVFNQVTVKYCTDQCFFSNLVVSWTLVSWTLKLALDGLPSESN